MKRKVEKKCELIERLKDHYKNYIHGVDNNEDNNDIQILQFNQSELQAMELELPIELQLPSFLNNI